MKPLPFLATGSRFARLAGWSVLVLLALLWTGAAFLMAELVQWGSQSLASGTAADVGRDLASLPVPGWLAFWIDPAWLQQLQAALAWGLDAGRDLLPWVGSAASWVSPLIWGAWAAGLLIMLVAGLGAHFVLGRLGR